MNEYVVDYLGSDEVWHGDGDDEHPVPEPRTHFYHRGLNVRMTEHCNWRARAGWRLISTSQCTDSSEGFSASVGYYLYFERERPVDSYVRWLGCTELALSLATRRALSADEAGKIRTAIDAVKDDLRELEPRYNHLRALDSLDLMNRQGQRRR